MKNKLISTIILLLCTGTICFGQYVPGSPEVEMMQKISGYQMNNSTGMPEISLPLYTIQHAGYQIPLSLSYANSGVKPGYNYDVYGFGWILTGKGKISRSLSYYPDEWKNFVIVPPYSGIDKLNEIINRQQAFSYLTGYETYDDFGHDTFHATFPTGENFSFQINNEGNNQILITKPLDKEIQISYETTNDGQHTNITSFVVTNIDGIKYTFAHTIINDSKGANNSYVSEWNLTRIDLPNSTLPIVYSYTGQNNEIKVSQASTLDGSLRVLGSDVVTETYVTHEGTEVRYPDDYFSRFNPVGNSVYNTVQQTVVSNITFGSTCIDFEYESLQKTEGWHSIDLEYSWLKYFTVTDGGSELKFTFNMSDFCETHGNFELKRLDSVVKSNNKDNQVQSHTFNYLSCLNVPSKSATDHWGYINNQSNMDGGLPYDFEVDLMGGVIGLGSIYVVDEIYDNWWRTYRIGTYGKAPGGTNGLLYSITYPTGGFTTFTWERNSYFNEWFNEQQDAAGHRIKYIKNYNNYEDLVSFDEYKYSTEPDVFTNYGIAPVEPNPVTYLSTNAEGISNISDYNPETSTKVGGQGYGGAFPHRNEYNFSHGNFLSLLGGRPSVVYPYVTVLHEGGDLGKTEFVYDYSHSTPGREGEFMEEIVLNVRIPHCYTQPGRYNKLKTKTVYRKTPTAYEKIQQEDYSWDFMGANFDSHLIWGPMDWMFAQSQPAYGTDPTVIGAWYEVEPKIDPMNSMYGLMDTVITSIYENGAIITTQQTYSYDVNHNVVGEESLDSKNNIIGKTYTRGGQAELVAKNMLSQVTATSDYKTPAGTTEQIITGKTKQEFQSISYSQGNKNCVLPFKSYSFDLSKNQYILENTVTYNTEIGGNQSTFVPIKVNSRVNGNTVYIWEYFGRYPVAKVINATESDVAAPFGSTDLGGIPSFSYNDITNWESNLRNSTCLSNAYIYTYKYNPLFGMTFQTDATGRITYYEYDGFGRLEYVKDNDANLLKKYEYNYVGQTSN